MWIIFLAPFFAFLPSSRSQNLAVRSRSCSYVGVFHVEGTQRYNLTFEEAKSLCKHLSASLAKLEEVQKAYDAGLQTCRYGWIDDGRSVILRHNAHKSCASNQTGIRILNRNHSDAFCYDAKDWLVILLVILAVLFILLLCVVAATRKRCCGRKQTLVISKVSSAEGNGTSASFTQQQETIKLMNTEKIPASNSEVVDISLNE
ncbi:hypothetical protein E1301_Tti019637 [Triplophysa tibetana]|uniref:CD44 antigen n=1 Tax=Triplophysa tibetana TaxID=1572043 RepID=A0A5A9PQU8_9TELE|nr:hypothetical protein E1301_Tti019637 [Triplophysa tibetana]